MEQVKEIKVKKENLYKRWRTLAEPNKKVWFWQTFFLVAYATCYALMTIFAARTISCLVSKNYNGAFFWLVVEVIDIWLRNILMHIQYKFYNKHYGIIITNISNKIYNKILNMDDRNLKNFSAEKIINIAQNNMSYACEFPDYVGQILQYSVQVAIALVTIYISNIYAGLIVTALGVLNFFVYNKLNKKLGMLLKRRYEKKDNSFKEYSRIIAGKTVINELNAKDEYRKKLIGHVDEFNKEYDKYYTVRSFRDNIYYAIWNLIVYSITAFLIYLVSQNAMDLSVYLVIVPYLTNCTTQLNTIFTKFGDVENMRVDVDRINLILSLSDKELMQYGNVNDSEGYNLGFINVSYANLKNMDITFKMNSVNIIKGGRNCGKRYIFDMLRRKIKPDDGKVLLDNLSLYDYNEKTFKTHIDYCSAHPVFINGSVKENLIIANNDFEFIKSLVSELNLEEKIASLPNGYDTDVADITDGESRFWIGLIRAALSKCKVLMIYEYPENVTPSFHTTLQHIIKTCEIDKRTLILFTHKNDYDDLADKIFTISNGKITSKPEN